MMRAMLTALSILCAGMAVADAPTTSLRPVARPASAPLTQTVAVQPEIARAAPAAIRPVARPATLNAPQAATRAAVKTTRALTPPASDGEVRQSVGRSEQRPGAVVSQPRTANAAGAVQTTERRGLFSSLRPLLRPRAVGKKAVARKQEQARGAVCGDVAIQGVAIGGVPGRINGCGIEDAVRVHEIGGVALSQKAVMDCQTATSIKRWINGGMKPAVGNYGGGVKELRIAAHYACRTRNNQRGAKISEHGRGRAIDIAGFALHDGSEITVLSDWNSGTEGRILRRLHHAACGPFGTVLGPDANRFHLDHFHFDTARYRSGAYCR